MVKDIFCRCVRIKKLKNTIADKKRFKGYKCQCSLDGKYSETKQVEVVVPKKGY